MTLLSTTRAALFASALVLPALQACGGGGEGGEAPAPLTVSPTEGQADEPRLAAGSVSVTELSRLEPAGRWSDAQAVAMDGDGHTYVLDSAVPARILKFDSAGAFLLRFGEDQDNRAAPTVIRQMSFAPEWNTILVSDPVKNVVASYLTLGMSSYTVEMRGGIPLEVLGRPQFGEYYLHAWDQLRSTSGVYHLRLPLDTLAVTYEVRIPSNAPVRKVMRDIYYRVTTDDAGRLYVAFQDGYPVRVLEPDGGTVRLQGIDRRGVARTSERIAAETEENLAKLRSEAPDLPDSLLMDAARPDSLLPVVEELDVDHVGRLWVRTHRADAAGATSYDVFDADGSYLARVDVPGAVRATTLAPDGTLVVLDESADEAGVVVRYEVRLGG